MASCLHRPTELPRPANVYRVPGKAKRLVQTLLGQDVCLAPQGLERVDLLKIDIERAELAALNGIAMSDWPKIQQVVLEVHDVADRLAAVKSLLMEKAGLHLTAVEQDPSLQGTTLYNVYACRQ